MEKYYKKILKKKFEKNEILVPDITTKRTKFKF